MGTLTASTTAATAGNINKKSIVISNIKSLTLLAKLHISSFGWDNSWQSTANQIGNTTYSGATGNTGIKVRKIEAAKFLVGNSLSSSYITVNAPTSNVGWEGYKECNGSNLVGKEEINSGIYAAQDYHSPYGIEAIQFKLSSAISGKYSIRYRVLNPYTKTWTEWAYDGTTAGTTGASQPICAIQVGILRK